VVVLENDKSLSGSDGVVPFPAVVGQRRLKQSLLVVASSPAVDGVLVRGEKGTAKSTAARGLAALLPDQRAVADCPYGCPPNGPGQCSSCRARTDPPVETRPVPFVTLPLGASRDRVVGSLSVSDALDGESRFEPGLLARANRGFLYVDEVNLLDDHLVDVLLDAAASGVNRVERDGVSRRHPSEFTLIGTMNPEEGSLRPQFRDRFALQVTVTGADDLDERATVVERALDGFDGDYDAETAAVRDRIVTARDLLPEVTLPDELTTEIAELCRDAGVDGHRGDIATARVARALAALDGRPRVLQTDVQEAAEFTLPHRLETTPFDDAPDPEEVIDDHFDGDNGSPDETEQGDADGDTDDRESRGETPEESDENARGGDGNARTSGENAGTNDENDETPRGDDGPDAPSPDDTGAGPDDTPDSEQVSDGAGGGERGGSETPGGTASPTPDGDDETDGADAGTGDRDNTADDGDSDQSTPLLPGQSPGAVDAAETTRSPAVDTPAADRAGSGDHAAATPDTDGHGATVRTERASVGDAVDAAASVRAAAARGDDEVTARDLRQSVETGGDTALVVFTLDASASMRGPMTTAKGVALDLLQDAYERRDEVAVVTFAGEDAEVVLPPTDSVELAARHLKSLPTGDRTPLPAGIETAAEVLDRADPGAAVVVIVTDGRANAGSSPTAATRRATRQLAAHDAEVLVVDAGTDQRTSLVGDVVAGTDGRRVPLAELTPDRVAGAVDRATGTRTEGESQ
jgi:magnesium chelatase subunit D